MDAILTSMAPSVANNSLPPPPRADRRKANFPKGSSAVKSEKKQSLAPGDPKKISLGARLPHVSDSSRRPSAPATYYSGPFPADSSRDDGTLDRRLQPNNVPPMLVRGYSARARIEQASRPTPLKDHLETHYPSLTKITYSTVPLSSSRSALELSNQRDLNPFYAPTAFLDRQRNNSSSSSISTRKSTLDSNPPPVPAPRSLTSPPELQSRPSKANKILGIGVSNVVPPESGYMEHRPPRQAYDDEAEHSAHNSKANKLLGLTPNEGTAFSPPPRSHSRWAASSCTTIPPLCDTPNLGKVHSNSGSRARVGSTSSSNSTQEIGDPGRWRRESFIDFSPSVPSHQKSKSQPEILSRPPDSPCSFQTTLSVVSTDSGIPAFSKRRPESIGRSQPNTTLITFKQLMKKVDGKAVKGGQAEDEWERIDAQGADFNHWGWGISSQERRPSDWAEAHTLPDEDREEQSTPEQTTPKQTTLDLSLAQSVPVNLLDQKERLAVIRKKMKITQLLGTGVPPYTLGPAIQDGTSMEHRESWEPLNNQETIYLDAQGKVKEEACFIDPSGPFVPKETEQSSLTSSILTTNDGVNECGRRMDEDMKGPDSPTSFMELSDEELDSHKGEANGVEYFPLPKPFSEIPIVKPRTPSIESSIPSSFSTFTDFSLSPPGSKPLKHKPSFITEILEVSDWEAHERKKKRDKLAKMHRFLGSRVPAELVLGYSSGTVPLATMLLEEDEEHAGKGKGRGLSPTVGRKNEREMRNIGTMGGSEKMVQIRRVQKIEKMFGEQLPSALLRPNGTLQAPSTPRPSSSSPPTRFAAPSSHSASRRGTPCHSSSGGTTPFAENVTYNINSLYSDEKRKDKFVPPSSSTPAINGTNSDSSSITSSAGSTIGLINGFKEQERGWKGKPRHASPPEGMDNLSAPLHKKSSYNSRLQPPPLKERHSAQFVHYRNSFKSLAMIIDMGDKTSLEELYVMLNSTSPAGSDTEAELAHTKHNHEVSGYESGPASPTGSLSRRRSHPSRMSIMSMSSVSSGSSLLTLTPEPMGFQARRKRAAKLTNFFGASYRDLFGEVLEKLEIGFLEEAREGSMSREEVADLMRQVKTLKKRKTEI